MRGLLGHLMASSQEMMDEDKTIGIVDSLALCYKMAVFLKSDDVNPNMTA